MTDLDREVEHISDLSLFSMILTFLLTIEHKDPKKGSALIQTPSLSHTASYDQEKYQIRYPQTYLKIRKNVFA